MFYLLRQYLRLMRIHDFSYNYSDDANIYFVENRIRIRIMLLKDLLLLTSRGRWFIARAERKWGHV